MTPHISAALLIAYRALSEGAAIKHQMVNTYLELPETNTDPMLHQTMKRLRLQYNSIIKAHAAAQNGIDDSGSNSFRHFALRFDTPAPFAAAGAFIPYVLATGKAIPEQDHWCALSVIPQRNSSMALFSWRDGHGTNVSKLVKSIHSVQDLYLGDWLLKFTVEHVEQVYFDPDWWADLTPGRRKMLID